MPARQPFCHRAVSQPLFALFKKQNSVCFFLRKDISCQVALELTIESRLSLALQSSCLNLLNSFDWVAGLCHQLLSIFPSLLPYSSLSLLSSLAFHPRLPLTVFSDWLRTCYIVHAVLKLGVLLLKLYGCWGYGHIPPYLAHPVLFFNF